MTSVSPSPPRLRRIVGVLDGPADLDALDVDGLVLQGGLDLLLLLADDLADADPAALDEALADLEPLLDDRDHDRVGRADVVAAGAEGVAVVLVMLAGVGDVAGVEPERVALERRGGEQEAGAVVQADDRPLAGVLLDLARQAVAAGHAGADRRELRGGTTHCRASPTAA